MSFAEIQDAVAKLSDAERKELMAYLVSQNLEESLNQAADDINSGKGIQIDDVRNLAGSHAEE
jgi:hypothetical protein